MNVTTMVLESEEFSEWGWGERKKIPTYEQTYMIR
jgi:hypothetical protein